MRLFLFIFFFLFLIFPYLVFLPHLSIFTFIDKKEFFEALWNSTFQSFISTFFCMFVGFIYSLGLLSVKPTQIGFWKILLVLPTFLPSLYVLLSLFSIFKPFPFGIEGIVLAHSLIYSGLAAVMIFELLKYKVSRFAELALVEGASKFQFLRVIITWIKPDLIYISLSLFIIFFTSFSIPLIIGKNTLILETLIYEKIKLFGEYGHALSYTFFQTLILLALTFILPKNLETSHKVSFNNSKILAIPYLHWIGGVFSLLLFFAPILESYSYFKNIQVFDYKSLAHFTLNFKTILSDFELRTLNTFILSVGVGFLIYILSLIALFISDSKTFQKFLVSYIVPSTALVGFALLLIDLTFLGIYEKSIKVVIGLSFLFIPGFYRFFLLSKFESIKSLLVSAKTMGGSSWFVFWKVTFPLTQKSVCLVSGLGAFWAASDFALSHFIYNKNETWSLYVYNSLNSYKLESASIWILIPVFIGLLSFLIFQGIAHVFSKKY